MKNPNLHIEKYLDHFCKHIQEPGFAVLIKGDWGSGKTWFINNYINKNGVEKFLFLSLYGLTSTNEIDDQIFIKLHPLLGSKPVVTLSQILKSAIKFGVNIDLGAGTKVESQPTLQLKKILDFTKGLSKKIIVFDDIERSKIDAETLLGYINTFVEHQKLKLILIGHEVILEKVSKDYKTTREKVIGQAFSIIPNYDEAIKTFIEQIKDSKCKKLFLAIVPSILDLFHQLGYNNLRNLKQTLLSFEYLYLNIDDIYKKEIEYFKKLFIAYAYLSLEMKASEISKDNWEEAIEIYSYSNISQKKFKTLDENERKKIIENARFGLLFNRYNIPLGKMLVDIVFDATINSTLINDAIKNSHYFVEKNKTTLGKFVSRWIRLSPEEFEDTYELLISELYELKYRHPAELLHATGILLLSSEKNLIPLSCKQIYDIILVVINRLVDESKLIKFDFGHGYIEEYGGYGYAKRDSEEFKSVLNILKESFYSLKINEINSEIQNMLNTFTANYYEFNRSLILYDVEGKFSRDPVLSFIDPTYFFSKYSNISNELKANFIHALKHRYGLRYSNGKLEEYLYPEEKFLIDLKNLIEAKIDSEEKLYNTDNLEFQYISDELKIILDWFKKHLAEKSIQQTG